MLHERAPESWRWLGWRVVIVDGTKLSMPDTEANQARFPQHGGQRPGQGYPLARVVGLFCLAGGALLDAACGAFGGKGNDEHSLLCTLLGTLERGHVLLGDANFPSYWLLAAQTSVLDLRNSPSMQSATARPLGEAHSPRHLDDGLCTSLFRKFLKPTIDCAR